MYLVAHRKVGLIVISAAFQWVFLRIREQLILRECLSFVVEKFRQVMTCKSWGVLTQEDWEFKKKASEVNFILSPCAALANNSVTCSSKML